MARPTISFRLILASFSTVVLLLARQIAPWTDESNRFLYHWQRSDALSYAAAILIATVVAAALAHSRWVRHSPRGRAIAGAVFVLLLANVAFAYILDLGVPRWLGILATPLALLAVMFIYGRFREQVLRAAVGVVLILSPLGPILLLQAMTWRTYDVRTRVQDRASDSGNAAGPPIVVLVLDEWSYRRSVVADEFGADLPNIRSVASKSFVFRRATSPGSETLVSMPGMLFEGVGALAPGDSSLVWERDGGSVPVPGAPSIFSRGSVAGYRTALYGFYLPYRELLGPSVAEVHSPSHFPKSRDMLRRIGWILAGNVGFMADPVSRRIGFHIARRRYNRNWYEVNRGIERGALDELARLREGRLVFVHLGVPHSPFVFGDDGAYRGERVFERMGTDTAGYRRHLRYADAVVGRLLAAIDRQGVLDGSLLVITSDHGWRMDPQFGIAVDSAGLTHVPLLIKWPGQTTQHTIDAPACLTGLGEVLRRAAGGDDSIGIPSVPEIEVLLSGPCEAAPVGARAATSTR